MADQNTPMTADTNGEQAEPKGTLSEVIADLKNGHKAMMEGHNACIAGEDYEGAKNFNRKMKSYARALHILNSHDQVFEDARKRP